MDQVEERIGAPSQEATSTPDQREVRTGALTDQLEWWPEFLGAMLREMRASPGVSIDVSIKSIRDGFDDLNFVTVSLVMLDLARRSSLAARDAAAVMHGHSYTGFVDTEAARHVLAAVLRIAEDAARMKELVDVLIPTLEPKLRGLAAGRDTEGSQGTGLRR